MSNHRIEDSNGNNYVNTNEGGIRIKSISETPENESPETWSCISMFEPNIYISSYTGPEIIDYPHGYFNLDDNGNRIPNTELVSYQKGYVLETNANDSSNGSRDGIHAYLNNGITADNYRPFIATEDTHITTKKYVDDKFISDDTIRLQVNNEEGFGVANFVINNNGTGAFITNDSFVVSSGDLQFGGQTSLTLRVGNEQLVLDEAKLRRLKELLSE